MNINNLPEQAITCLMVLSSGLFMGYLIFSNSPSKELKSQNKPINTILIDGCQYLTYDTYQNFMGITHKGNCTNSIHLCKN